MFLGYNTNGFAHHRLEDAIEIIAELGYGGVAWTPDVNHLNPYNPLPLSHAGEVRALLEPTRMRCVVETGARFLLDPRRKHQPTLISPTATERKRRLDFLTEWLYAADAAGADCVSFWSGTAIDDAPPSELMNRL